MDAEHKSPENQHDRTRTRIDGMVWVDGVLHLRCTTRWLDEHGREPALHRSEVTDGVDRPTCRLLLQGTAKEDTRLLPAQSTVTVTPVPGDDDRVRVQERTEARFDPQELPAGAAHGTWEICAEDASGRRRHKVTVGDDVPARPAIVGATAYVARRDQDGGLHLEADADLHALTTDRRWRAAAAQVSTTPGERRRTNVEITAPVDGIRVYPTDTAHTIARGTVELVAPVDSSARRALDKVRRRLGASTAHGGFTVTTDGDTAVLRLTASATPGLWNVVLTPQGSSGMSPFLVKVGRNGSARVVPAPDAGPAGDALTMPRVSVIVPVHNGAETVEEAIRSVFAQSMPAELIEIIAVDDGSTDDSWAILRRLAKNRARMQVFTQPASGTAAAPRNAGIEASTGRYLFFLDADDLLTPTALEKMADAADALEADVVLGKMEGFAGRSNVPRRVFRHTTLDADMVANAMMNALGPTKMFRAEHVKRRAIRFPTGLRHGEDQAFVAEAEFTARRIVILTDAVYYWVRGHGPRHMPRAESVIDIRLRKTRLVAGLVERHTEPGNRRDALLPRPFGDRALEGVFRRAYLALDPQERADLVDRVADEFGHLWTPGLRALLKPHARMLYDLVFRRDPENLTALVEHAKGDPRRLPVIAGHDGFFLDVPPSVEDVFDRDARRTEPPRSRVPTTRLTSLRLDPDGRPEAVVSVPPKVAAPKVFARVEGHGGRHQLPWSRVDRRHVAARLPVPFTETSFAMTLTVSHRGVLTPGEAEHPLQAVSADLRAEAGPAGPGRPAAREAVTVRVTRTSAARTTGVATSGPPSPGQEDGPIRLWWWRRTSPTEQNFGDEMTAPLLERLTGRQVVWTPMAQAEIVGAGSVLQMALRARAHDMPVVWGAGTIRPATSKAPPEFVPCAVRGRLSLESLSPEAQASTALGDPGILADRLVDGPVSKRYTLGVIPHYKDARDPTMLALAAMPGVRYISVAWTPEEVAREIAACHVVVSSSMHGLIFADALGVPNAQLRVSDKLVGGDFKFRDYDSAFGPDRYQPPLTPADVRDLDVDRLVDLVRSRFRPPTGLEELQRRLVEALPFSGPGTQTVLERTALTTGEEAGSR